MRGSSTKRCCFICHLKRPKQISARVSTQLWGSRNGRSSTLLCLRIRRRSRREPSLTWRGGVAHDAKGSATCGAWRPTWLWRLKHLGFPILGLGSWA
ncbi:hypothetical protein ERO13_A11G118450v2 [Gossypium hirsutum]|uniref:Uncharacterized protein n=3 Tax=Gossypium TaxID=3633 RepID=A0A5J5TRM7_GOSBA|nr:hypothetical protein ES319_A11G127000v1 [Gossypium barbadense]KAG4174399.1 hypothetical protein ERO13_A11G118450v2 [Gossypium hirsutum]TYG93750.1 hypothetical protein ES288_A11G135900v1 [Gossypium darwinii]TYI00438.1 hypothetical protein ES332_A11G134900v1 [Gossypium tomentosum]